MKTSQQMRDIFHRLITWKSAGGGYISPNPILSPWFIRPTWLLKYNIVEIFSGIFERGGRHEHRLSQARLDFWSDECSLTQYCQTFSLVTLMYVCVYFEGKCWSMYLPMGINQWVKTTKVTVMYDCVNYILQCNTTAPKLRGFQFSSVAQLCLTLCDPMNCSTPGFPVHRQLLESTQTHVHWVGDAI